MGSSQEKVSISLPDATLGVCDPSAVPNFSQDELLSIKPHPELIHLSEQEQLARGGTTEAKKEHLHIRDFPRTMNVDGLIFLSLFYQVMLPTC